MSSNNPLIAPELHTLAQDFLWNANHTLADASPFYEKLARRVAEDPDMLTIAAHAQRHQPAMNLLFSSVHYLLMQGLEDPLRLFFADLARRPNMTDDPYPIFRAFVFEHRERMVELISTRRVQTNEVARCAYFLPVFTLVSKRLAHAPFQLIEVGSSAGLNLNWDRYAYDYGTGNVYGDAASPVVIPCALRAQVPPLPETLPPVAGRIGIDLHPNDVFDDDAMLWLRALVWPEQLERAQRLEQAIALARGYPPVLWQGDALVRVPERIQELPRSEPIVLFHSFVLNQVPQEMRTRYYDSLAEASVGRRLFDIAIEPSAFPCPVVLTTFERGERFHENLAICDHHGRWLEWTGHDAAV